MSQPITPTDIVKQSAMSRYQYAIVAICMLAYAADGLDVVTLSYAAPVMIKELHLSIQGFGLASSATPVGVAIGSIFVAPLADRIGRRALTLTLLGSLVVLLLITATNGTITTLMILRLLTGVCLGALVVCLNVTVTEFSNEKRSNLLIGILHSGYAFGGMLCGAMAGLLIEPYGWRSIFLGAAVLNLTAFILGLFILADSPAFLMARRPPDALARINALMRRMRKPEVAALPEVPIVIGKQRASLTTIPRSLWIGTALLCLAGFVFTISGGFMAGWRPQILSMAGMNMQWNGVAGVTTYGAGIIAQLIVGALSRRVGEVRIATIFLLAMAASFTLLGAVPDGANWALVAASTLCGFFNVGAYTALILVTLNYHGVATRNAGLGIMLGCSRIGGIIGPLLGGYVIGAGVGRFSVMLLFGGLMILPAAAAVLVRMRAARQQPDPIPA
jgi:MFS family permease